MTEQEPNPPDENPFEVSQIRDHFSSRDRSKEPGPVAIFFSVVLGLAVAVGVFGVTFFFTCLGIYSISSLDNAAGAVIIWGVAILSAIGAFFFTMWGLLKVVKSFKK